MAERVIWERTIDYDKIAHRRARFQKLFFPPAIAIVLLVLVLASWQDALGAAFVVGMVGLVWGNTVRYQSLSDAANPTLTVEHGRLRLGDREIIMEDVKKFTTLATSTQTSLLGKYSRVQLGKAIFRYDVPGSRREPQLSEFGWPNMGEVGVASLTEALQKEMPGKWIEPAELLTVEELPKRRRRHGI